MININYIEKKDTFTAMNIPSMEGIKKWIYELKVCILHTKLSF